MLYRMIILENRQYCIHTTILHTLVQFHHGDRRLVSLVCLLLLERVLLQLLLLQLGLLLELLLELCQIQFLVVYQDEELFLFLVLDFLLDHLLLGLLLQRLFPLLQ